MINRVITSWGFAFYKNGTQIGAQVGHFNGPDTAPTTKELRILRKLSPTYGQPASGLSSS